MRLKTTQVRKLRQELLERQNHICPLCGTEILPEEAAMDHDHDHGNVRQVLHRSCNQAEGRIKSWINRSRFSGDHKVFLENLLNYLETDYSTNPEHPTHLTKKVKKFKAKNKIEQIQILKEMGIDIPEKSSKDQLTKLYRKTIQP